VAAKAKLTDEQVKRLRRRVRRGEHITDLAAEFGVNRKTIRRRLNHLESAERAKAQRTEANRLRRQASRERSKLLARDDQWRPTADVGTQVTAMVPRTRDDHYTSWLDSRKNLSGRARAEASGLVRVCNPDRTICVWRERAEVDALFEAGWRLA
jgi:hypothetical protein